MRENLMRRRAYSVGVQPSSRMGSGGFAHRRNYILEEQNYEAMYPFAKKRKIPLNGGESEA